jgi:cytochrome c oxidase subunit II
VPASALITTQGQYDHLYSIYVPIAIGVCVVIFVVVLGSVLRARRRAVASPRAENNPLEIGYAVLLTLTAAFLVYLTLVAEHRVDTVANHERPAVIVDVTSAKWEWEFRYPRSGIVAHSGEVGRQPLVVPANRAVRFNLTSLDVIHSFWIPQTRFKRQLIPGTVEHVTLTFTHPGLLRGQCAEFCGLRHPEMVFNVRVLRPNAFAAWARAHRAAGATARATAGATA